MKVLDLLKISEAFNYLSEKELDLNTAYTIANNLHKLTVGQNVVTGKRKKLVDTYAEKDAAGELILGENGDVQFSPANRAAFFAEIEKLNESEIDLEKIGSLSKEALLTSGIKIPPKYLLFLSDYIQDDTNNKNGE